MEITINNKTIRNIIELYLVASHEKDKCFVVFYNSETEESEKMYFDEMDDIDIKFL